MPSIAIAPSHKAIERYYAELAQIRSVGADYEQATRAAFQALLTACAPTVGWTLILEQPLANGKRPDGTLRDAYFARGYWEAKDTRDDLDGEIKKKREAGYPVTNTIFEDTRRAVLFQGGRVAMDVDITERRNLADLLTAFFGYVEPEIATFEAAITEFKGRIPELAASLKELIRTQEVENAAFKSALASFYTLCQTSLDPNISWETVREMLVQHLLTERLFRTVFQNPDFVRRNVIAAEIEKVIDALTSKAFNRGEFLRSLARFYVAIEAAAQGLEDWSEKQHFMNVVYERFFQGYSTKQADTHGIVYTPQEIVDFMCTSVEEVLQREFGKSLSDTGVQILDPATGTGSFVVNLLRRISGATLERKYREDLFANEIMLLPYYIASLNIEHAYYERTGSYLPFEGLCFTDTLELAEARQMSLFVERNHDRVEREKAADIMVVIGNPPYNVGQENENDNNKNRKYPVIDGRIRETYAKDSKATLKTKYYDAYVKFFRWATDRLQGRDGIVCFITNNAFVRKDLLDGIRKHLAQDFTTIYHLDLGGDMREGGGGNVFGITPGVGVTVLIRRRDIPQQEAERARVHYHKVEDALTGTEKLHLIASMGGISNLEWEELDPNEHYAWINEGLHPEFESFMPIGSQEAKTSHLLDKTIFQTFSLGVGTNRDEWVYAFQAVQLMDKVQRLIKNYNSEVFRWTQEGSDPKRVDDFVNNEPTFVKWTDRLKASLVKMEMLSFDTNQVRQSLYRPFSRRYLYFDHLLNQRRYQQHHIYPTSDCESENSAMQVGGYGRKDFSVLATNCIPDLNFYADPAQCFPLYTYAEDGSARRENVTDWALAQFQAAYGPEVTKRDIFDYVYGLLHHPRYRARYAENLKRELPRIPLLPTREGYEATRAAGAALAALHLGYESVREYPLRMRETPGEPVEWRVKKMKLVGKPNGQTGMSAPLRAEATPQVGQTFLSVSGQTGMSAPLPQVGQTFLSVSASAPPSGETATLVYNDWLTLEGIPPEVFAYRLGNRSALEWVIDQYQVSTDTRSGITSDPNRPDDPQYIVRLIRQVVTVSVETVRLVDGLARSVDLLAALGITVEAAVEA
ncbi:MAG: Helicase domain protein [Ktedonobacterales bacterium]|jgi:predicted helicase|nr:MAG: Helicase domain protein [Ktedonobacterales bacterium]